MPSLRPAALLAALLLTSTAAGEEARGERLVLVGVGSTCAELEDGELEDALRSYLAGLAVEILTQEAGPSAPTRELVIEVMARCEATLALWCLGGGPEELSVHILDGRGPVPMERTLEVGDQPAPVISRTVAAVVRTVIENVPASEGPTAGGPLAVEPSSGPAASEPSPREGIAPEPSQNAAAMATPVEGRLEGERPPAAEGLEEQGGASSPLGFDLLGGYVLRAGQRPGPILNGVGLRGSLLLVRWLLIGVAGRYALPADLDRGHGGTLRRAAVAFGLGLGRRLERVTLGLLVGLDLEWLWGAASTGRDEPDRAFHALGVGVSLDGVLSVTLWRGLILSIVVTAVTRPKRFVVLMQGEPVASTGFVEAGFELSLGWRFQ